MLTRRRFAMTTLAGLTAGCFGEIRSGRAEAKAEGLSEALARIERNSGGRLGVAVLDTAGGAMIGQHADDRFPMCSTFKILACSAVLKRVESGKEKLDRRIPIEAKDIVPDSSFIKHPDAAGMTMEALCEAAMTWSDNTAANLILTSLGGPAAVTAYARSIGDTVTRLDRTEPTLNEAVPGDLRDTTTPAAMLKNLQTLVLGDALSADSKHHLTGWLLGNKTGDTRMRAGLPAGWRCGDKTGSGERGTTNDVGLIWPPHDQAAGNEASKASGKPILVAIYLTETAAPADKRNATLAAIGRAVAMSAR